MYKQKLQQEQLRKQMQNKAVAGNRRLNMEVDHLMTGFDQFYEQVVSRQLVKDKIMIKKKYANVTALGEGEQNNENKTNCDIDFTPEQQEQQQEELQYFDTQDDYQLGYAQNNYNSSFNGNSKAASKSRQQPIMISSQQFEDETDLKMNNDQQNDQQIGETMPDSGNQQYLQHYVSPQNKVMKTQRPFSQSRVPLKRAAQTSRNNCHHNKEYPVKPGSGIAQYTSTNNQALLRQFKRAQSGLTIGTNNTSRRMIISQGSYKTQTNLAKQLTGNECKNRDSQVKANNEHLIQKMLTDDEQYREKLLRGYYQLSKTTRGSPIQGINKQNVQMNDMNQTMIIDQRPVTARTNATVYKAQSKIAPQMKEQLQKVKQIYKDNGPSWKQQQNENTYDMVTMHTSDANHRTKRQINLNNQNSVNQAAVTAAYQSKNYENSQAENRDKSDNAAYADQVNFELFNNLNPSVYQQPVSGQNFYNIKVSRPGQQRINENDQVFKSLEIEHLFKGGQNNMAMVDADDPMAQQYRMKQRPMTGAAAGSNIKKSGRLGPYGGRNPSLNPLLGQQSNRMSVGQYTNTLQSMTKRGYSGVFTNQYSKNEKLSGSNRNRSIAHFSSGQHRQSQGMVGNSLQNMNLQDRNFERAKSSTQNHDQRKQYNSRTNRTFTAKARENNTSADRNSRYQNLNLSATALSQIPPKTNVPILDQYYQNYNTQGQIGTIRFISEFERLSDKIEKFWKLKSTPMIEREKVGKILEQMRIQGESHECSENIQRNMRTGMIEYLNMMKDYYFTEIKIRNIYQERETAAKELILVSKMFDQELFQVKGISLVLKLRMLTVKLVYAVKRWKEMVKRATATFTIQNALEGRKIGKQITINELNESKQQIKSLKPSSNLTQSSVSTQASFKSTGFEKERFEVYKHQYQQQQKQKTKAEQSLEKCILCHIFEDTTLQKEGGLLIRKLANFTNDSIVFSMKSLHDAKNDIQKLAFAFKKEPAFKFNQTELTYFERIIGVMEPKSNAKKHMGVSINYLKSHICQAASGLKPKPKDYEFDFDWDCEDFQIDAQMRAAQKNCLSEVQWNFSNLDRTDRIHKVYTTLQDSMAQLHVNQGQNVNMTSQQMHVNAQEQVIDEAVEVNNSNNHDQYHDQLEKSPSLKLSNQSPPQSEGQAPRSSNPNMMLYNLDLNEQLFDSQDKKMASQTEVASATHKPTNLSPMEAYEEGQQHAEMNDKKDVLFPTDLKVIDKNEDKSVGANKSNTASDGNIPIIEKSDIQVEKKQRNSQDNLERGQTEIASKQMNLIDENQSKEKVDSIEELTESAHEKSADFIGEEGKNSPRAQRIIHAEISENIDLFNNNSSQKLSQESSPAKAAGFVNGLAKTSEENNSTCSKPMMNQFDLQERHEQQQSSAEFNMTDITKKERLPSAMIHQMRNGNDSSEDSSQIINGKTLFFRSGVNSSQNMVGSNRFNSQHSMKALCQSQDNHNSKLNKNMRLIDPSNEESAQIEHAEYNLIQNSLRLDSNDMYEAGQNLSSSQTEQFDAINKSKAASNRFKQRGSETVQTKQILSSESESLGGTKKLGDKTMMLLPHYQKRRHESSQFQGIHSIEMGIVENSPEQEDDLMNYAQTELAARRSSGANISINNSQVEGLQKGENSSTIQTDKSPGDYVNQVTIGFKEGDVDEIVNDENHSSQQREEALRTEQSVAMSKGDIKYQSQHEVARVQFSNKGQSQYDSQMSQEEVKNNQTE